MDNIVEEKNDQREKGISKKSAIIRIIIFVLLFAVFFVWLSYLMRPEGLSKVNLSGYYAEKNDTIDLVAIGASTTYDFWVPMQVWNDYGITSYNVASPGIPATMIKYYIIETQKTQSPKMYIIDVRSFERADYKFDEDAMEEGETHSGMYIGTSLHRAIDAMQYSQNRVEAIKNCVPDDVNKIDYYFDFFKYHSAIESLTKDDSWTYSLGIKKNYHKGFFLHPKQKNVKMSGDYSGLTEKDPLPDDVDDVLRDLLEFCKSEDLQVMFFISPYMMEEAHMLRFNYIEEVITEYGYECINWNKNFEDFDFNLKKDFYNGNHANIFGAEKFTKVFSEYLTEHYDLPDRRNDPKYQGWHDDYEEWEIESGKTKYEINQLIK